MAKFKIEHEGEDVGVLELRGLVPIYCGVWRDERFRTTSISTFGARCLAGDSAEHCTLRLIEEPEDGKD